MFFVSVVTIGAIVVDYGFVLDSGEASVVSDVYRCAWWFYFLTFTLRLVLCWRGITRKTAFMTAVLGVLLYLSALPELGIMPPWPWLWGIVGSRYYVVAVLGLFAMLEVSRGVVGFINKKTNPALLMATCFAVIIIFGALLLLLPRSTLDSVRLPVVDALFVSTSAVCVTGLSTVDVAQTFSMEGQIVIALLIQIGGLGVMTITSFFALFFMGGTGLYSQFALRDMVGTDTFGSLISTLLYILGFTFVIEGVGALCIWLDIHSAMDMELADEIFFAVFHAVSAFCNAGFSTLSGNLGNPAIITGHNGFFIILSLLVILGGIGFPLLINLRRILAYYLAKLYDKVMLKGRVRPRYTHIANINTKIVVVVTAVLLSFGTVAIAILEWNGAFAGMAVQDKFVQSFFNAVSPRTAGFSSVDLAQFSSVTLLLYMFLMWVGGASQSTAGGIKVNTLAVAVANFISVVRGRDRVELFRREVSGVSVRRASAVVFGSIAVIAVFFASLVIMEPGIAPGELLFETVSAFGTVGSSLGVTARLGDGSRVLMSVLMFVGRVGLITVIMSVVQQSGNPKYRFPKDNVIIN